MSIECMRKDTYATVLKTKADHASKHSAATMMSLDASFALTAAASAAATKRVGGGGGVKDVPLSLDMMR